MRVRPLQARWNQTYRLPDLTFCRAKVVCTHCLDREVEILQQMIWRLALWTAKRRDLKCWRPSAVE
jgi:hypothetical protein